MSERVRLRRLGPDAYGDTSYETRCGRVRVHRLSRDLWLIEDDGGTLAEVHSLSEARWWIAKHAEVAA